MKNLFTIALVLAVTATLHAQKFTISGYVQEKGSQEHLIGTNIFDQKSKQGTTSNTYGYYSITLDRDSVDLLFSYVGYSSQIFNLLLDQDTVINVSLAENIMLDEVVIRGDRSEPIAEITQMSTVNVPIRQIKQLPALLGEVDVLKALQLLPGVQSGTEGSSGIYVRGGGPDQNLILLDGVPVYNASHLFGFFSVFNADAINNVQLIKGGFPARYGGRLSSVIDISLKEGNKEAFHGEGSIGLISSKLTLEGPINDKTSFIVSGRRTYIDLLARPIIKATTDGDETAGYFFYDLNAKVNYQISSKDRVYWSVYLGDDKAHAKYKDSYSSGSGFRTENEYEFGLKWGNITSAFRWNHVFNPKLFANTTITYSRYRFDVFEDDKYTSITPSGTETEKFGIKYLSGIDDWAAKLDFDYLPSPDHFVRFGIAGIRHTFKPGAFAFNSNIESDTTFGADKTRAVEWTAYIEDDFKWGSKLKLNLGVHLSGFEVEDTWYTSLQPRAALRWLWSKDLSFKASYAQMTQYIHLLTNSGIGLPTDLWVPSTSKIKPQQSYQFAAGFAKSIGSTYEVSVEGYYKHMDNLIEYQQGATFYNVDKDWQSKVETGEGSSYGGELLIQKKLGKMTGWLGYTLSWTNRKFDNLNFGKRFPAKYDRRHDISLVLTRPLGKNVDAGFAWVYGTGNAISLPVATYPRAGGISRSFGFGRSLQVYEARNDYRMKAYHRMDLSFNFHKEKKRGTRTWSLGVYNIYNRRNPFFIDLGYDLQGNKRFVQYSIFQMIPSIRYSFKF